MVNVTTNLNKYIQIIYTVNIHFFKKLVDVAVFWLMAHFKMVGYAHCHVILEFC